MVNGGGGVQREDFAAFLQRKGQAFQDAALGPARARMFRSGVLTIRDMIDAATGRPLTLKELQP